MVRLIPANAPKRVMVYLVRVHPKLVGRSLEGSGRVPWRLGLPSVLALPIHAAATTNR